MENQTSIKCHGCGAERYSIIGKSKHSIIEIHGDKTFVQQPFSVQECNECGLVYKYPILSEEQIHDFYSSYDFNAWGYKSLNPPEKKVYDFIKEKYQNKIKILDFGCSIGRFLTNLPENFDRFGYDVDDRSLKIASENGVIPLSYIDIKDTKFDVIVMFDIFEHLANPTDIIEYLISSLSKDGLLVISTGTSDSKIFKIQKHRFWYIDTMSHFILINKKYIDYLCNKFNLNPIKLIPTSHKDTSIYVNLSSRFNFLIVLLMDFVIPTTILAKLGKIIPKFAAKLNRNRYPGITGVNDHVVVILEKKSY